MVLHNICVRQNIKTSYKEIAYSFGLTEMFFDGLERDFHKVAIFSKQNPLKKFKNHFA